MDPFYSYEHFDIAESKLIEGLRSFPPFKIKVEKFNYFAKSKSNVLWMEPVAHADRPSKFPNQSIILHQMQFTIFKKLALKYFLLAIT
jgi:2'-5' RNA ligase